MCGIIGIFGSPHAKRKILAGLAAMQERGRDCYGIANKKAAFTAKDIPFLEAALKKASLGDADLLGHCLHAMVRFVPQPFVGKGTAFVANCEVYNWKELDRRYELHAKNDAHLIMLLLQRYAVEDILPLLDGPYAFAFWKDDTVIVARDIIGEKPIWYSTDGGFSFASEKKALLAAGAAWVEELNPRHILTHDLKKGKTASTKRTFFERIPENEEPPAVMLKKLQGLLVNAVAKRIPDEKVGVLFSGGVDSVLIAKILKDLGADFTCYVASAAGDAEDALVAREAAAHNGFRLKEAVVPLKDVPGLLQEVIPLIEDSNAVKAAVGLTMHAAIKRASQDGIRVVYSGLGAEELFAGYSRHRKTLESTHDAAMVNEDCLWGLRKLYERDLYRDDAIAMKNSVELRLPFLDTALVDFAVKIPASMKLSNGQTKAILREAAISLGVEGKYAMRKKVAAQYGSRFDKAIQKLARKGRFPSRSAYLRTFYPLPNLRLGCLFSSGKDSHLALHLLKSHNYEISCLITLLSRNPDSYMFHTPAIGLARLQATALNIPLIEEETAGDKEEELVDLRNALIKARTAHHIEGVVTGAIASSYQRERIERIADDLGLKVFCPLWRISQETELAELLRCGFLFIMSSVAAEGLDESWLNRPVRKEEIEKLIALNKKTGMNVAGEGGEYESLVLDGPGYAKRVVIDDYHVVKDGMAARMTVKKAHLEEK